MGVYVPSPLFTTLRATLAALLLLAACSSGDGDDKSDDCLAQEFFGPNFRCPGARRPTPLQVGEVCWGSGPNANSEYRVVHHGIQYSQGRSCAPQLYCNPVRGCQPRIAAGDPCDDVPPNALWGVCQDEGHACYPAEPLRDGDPQGPRICRPLPTQPGEWCAAELNRLRCLRGNTGGTWVWACPRMYRANHRPGGCAHAQAWSGQTFNGEHLATPRRPDHYPALRVHELICQDQRCTPPPPSGESCAVLACAQTTRLAVRWRRSASSLQRSRSPLTPVVWVGVHGMTSSMLCSASMVSARHVRTCRKINV